MQTNCAAKMAADRVNKRYVIDNCQKKLLNCLTQILAYWPVSNWWSNQQKHSKNSHIRMTMRYVELIIASLWDRFKFKWCVNKKFQQSCLFTSYIKEKKRLICRTLNLTVVSQWNLILSWLLELRHFNIKICNF